MDTSLMGICLAAYRPDAASSASEISGHSLSVHVYAEGSGPPVSREKALSGLGDLRESSLKLEESHGQPPEDTWGPER